MDSSQQQRDIWALGDMVWALVPMTVRAVAAPEAIDPAVRKLAGQLWQCVAPLLRQDDSPDP